VLAAVCASPPNAAPLLAAPALQLWFGLSRAESKVARELAAGRRTEDIGRALGISTRTARTQLQAVYEKTGVRRQAELVRLLLTSPASVLPSNGKQPEAPQVRNRPGRKPRSDS
jgi:DNA-binding CsgD family transcriptional regulator